MKYLVIGLGNLGRAIAESLTRIGNEVIGVDINPHKTEAVKHTISGAISLDTTDKDALNTLPLNEMDAIFVTFGKDFGTSIQTVALLKNLDVNKLIVRGISPIHEAVIRSIGVAEIITPEDDFAGADFTRYIHIRKKMHFYLDNTVTGACLTSSAFNIKAESAFGISSLLGVLSRCKQVSYHVKYTCISCRIRPWCSSNW